MDIPNVNAHRVQLHCSPAHCNGQLCCGALPGLLAEYRSLCASRHLAAGEGDSRDQARAGGADGHPQRQGPQGKAAVRGWPAHCRGGCRLLRSHSGLHSGQRQAASRHCTSLIVALLTTVQERGSQRLLSAGSASVHQWYRMLGASVLSLVHCPHERLKCRVGSRRQEREKQSPTRYKHVDRQGAASQCRKRPSVTWRSKQSTSYQGLLLNGWVAGSMS